MKIVEKVLFAALFIGLTPHARLMADWNRFRGVDGKGLASEDKPVAANLSDDANLLWKTPLPGSGVSSPIIVGDRVYLTADTGYGLDMENPGDEKALVRHLLAFDRTTGSEVWRKSVAAEGDMHPYAGFVCQHGYASSTPASDGENIYVLFGSTGLFGFDRDGNELWRTDVGKTKDPSFYGDASSPIVYGDLVIVNASAVGRQLVAVNKASGEIVWSVKDKSFTNSWSTPVVVSSESGDQILFGVPGKVIAIDPTSGQQVWSADSPIQDAVCSSILVDNGVAYIMGGRNGKGIAIRLGGTGDVTDTHILWNRPIRSSICTPVIYGDRM